MTKHDMNSPVLQHQATTIIASKMISTEHQNRQEGTTATTEGMAYPTRVGILGVAASVFPVVYICIKLVGSQLGTGMAGQVAQVTQMVFILSFDVYLERIANFVIGVCVMVVLMSLSNDCGLSLPVDAVNYVIDCGSLNLTAVPSGINTKVTELILAENLLEYLEPDCFKSLLKIQRLNLRQNMLTSLPSDIFKNQHYLNVLDLSWNLLTSVPPNIGRLTLLEYLWLHDNKIDNLPLGIFDHNIHLDWLNLRNNFLTSLPRGIFDNIDKLHTLDLAGNAFANLKVDIFIKVNVSIIFIDLSVVCPSITEWRESIIGKVALMEKDVKYTLDQPDLCLGITQSQLQTTKHDMNSPVLQHQLTTTGITASKMMSTEHQNRQEGKTATTEGITQSQLQTTKHDMNSPVLQHQLTTTGITASKMMSTEHQNRQEGKTATTEGITQSQLQTTKHDMNSPVLQHQLTTTGITASKMMSTEHQNRQEGKTATTEGMAYTTCVGILGVAASVFPVVYIGIKLVGSRLGTGMAGQAARATQSSIKNDRSGDFVSEQMKIDITKFVELTTEKQHFHGWINIPPVDYKDSIQ